MQNSDATQATSRGKWMALTAALLGWLFDGFEMGMFPLVGPKALEELLTTRGTSSATVTGWFAVIMAMFLIGAATGGVVFGWLGDRIGRVRAMSLSILTYAIFTGLCGFATQAWHIAVLRFVASLGMGGEWALGVSLVIELWSDRSRAFLAGLIGAAANVGYLLVGLISLLLLKGLITDLDHVMRNVGVSAAMVDSLLNPKYDGWRFMMIIGALPALLVFFVMLLVPESHKWEAERAKGATSHWATRDLLGVLLGAIGAAAVVFLWSPVFEEWARGDAAAAAVALPGWATFIRVGGSAVGLVVALVGFLFPVSRYLERAEVAGDLDPGDRGRCIKRLLLGAALAGVALLGTWGSLQWAPKWAIPLAKLLPADGGPHFAKEYTMIFSALGAIVGTILAALSGDWLGRRVTYTLLCIGSFISLVFLYRMNDIFGAHFLWSVFAAGGITAAFYGWFPLYLPELFPTSIRATSQGFAFNFGRVIAAVGTLQTAALTAWFAQGIAPDRKELEAFPKAGATLAAIYLIGVVIIWLGPETKGKPLPERIGDI